MSQHAEKPQVHELAVQRFGLAQNTFFLKAQPNGNRGAAFIAHRTADFHPVQIVRLKGLSHQRPACGRYNSTMFVVRINPVPHCSGATPFVETMREMQEMRYLWRDTVLMDNARLVAHLGAEPHTPWDEAVGTTLRSLRCV